MAAKSVKIIGWFAIAWLGLSPMTTQAEFFVGEGATGAPFLKVPQSARATSLAGAYTGIFGDSNTLDYNPAGLIMTPRTNANLAYNNYLEDASLQSLTIAFPYARTQFATREEIVNSDDFFTDHYFFGFQYKGFSLEDTRRNDIGANLGDFDVKSQMIQFAAAIPISYRTALGGSAKIIQEKIDSFDRQSWAGDVGLLTQYSKEITIGASMLNLGPSKAFKTEREPLPLQFRTGAAFTKPRYTIASDFALGRDKVWHKSIGIEGRVYETSKGKLSLRGGLLHHTSFELSMGFGYIFGAMSFEPKEAKRNQDIFDDLMVAEETSLSEEKNISIEEEATPEPSDIPPELYPSPLPVDKKKPPPLEFGFDFSLRTNKDLGLTQIFNFQIFY